MTVDLTGYCWELIQRNDGRVRFALYCAPKQSRALRDRLENVFGVRLRRHSRSSLRTDKPEEVLEAVKMVGGAADVIQNLESYVYYWKLEKSEDVDRWRRQHGRRAVVLAGGRFQGKRDLEEKSIS